MTHDELKHVINSTLDDARKWRYLVRRLNQSMTPMVSSWEIVSTSPMSGDQKVVTDWEAQIEKAICDDIARSKK